MYHNLDSTLYYFTDMNNGTTMEYDEVGDYSCMPLCIITAILRED